MIIIVTVLYFTQFSYYISLHSIKRQNTNISQITITNDEHTMCVIVIKITNKDHTMSVILPLADLTVPRVSPVYCGWLSSVKLNCCTHRSIWAAARLYSQQPAI